MNFARLPLHCIETILRDLNASSLVRFSMVNEICFLHVEKFLKCPSFPKGYFKDELLILCCYFQNNKLLRKVLELPGLNYGVKFTVQPPMTVLDIAVARNNIETINILLDTGKLDISNGSAIFMAASEGKSEILRTLLAREFDLTLKLQYPISRKSLGIDEIYLDYPFLLNFVSLSAAAQKGLVDIVKILLEDRRFDPSAFDSLALRSSSSNGHAKVVELLLKDKRVDPTAFDSHALEEAVRNGHEEVVRLLLKDGRSNPRRVNIIDVMYEALIHKHVGVIKLLLEDDRLDEVLEDEYRFKLEHFVRSKRI